MHRTTEDQVRGIRWTPLSYLEDLDYADDIALLSHTHTHIQEKTQRLNTFAKQFGLNISSKKTEIMALNATNTPQVQIDSEELHYTDRFTYLGSIISRDGGTDLDIQSRLNKARNSLNMMNKVWLSHLQHSYQAEALSQLRPYNPLVWLRMLALNGEGSIKALHLSHQKPSAYLTHLLAKCHFQQRSF